MSGESINEFICTLCQKIVNCGISFDQQKHLLAIMFSIRILSRTMQEKLLAQNQMELDKFLTIARADEAVEVNARALLSEMSKVGTVNKFNKLAKFSNNQGKLTHATTSANAAKLSTSDSGCRN